MKNILYLSVLIGLLAGCNQSKNPAKQNSATMATIAEVAVKDTANIPPLSKRDSLLKALQVQYGEDYEGYIKAVRKLVLQQMDESILKNSCLEEFYLQKLAQTTNDSIIVTLPFDLHTYDCGAPDCYTTKVRFSLPNKTPITFPQTLPFYEEQIGCMEEYHFKDVYKLVEATHKHVIYHCEARKRTLVLFFLKENGSWYADANYFVNVSKKRFNGKNIYTVAENYDDNKPESEWNKPPYMITSFTKSEYEYMLKE